MLQKTMVKQYTAPKSKIKWTDCFFEQKVFESRGKS